MIKSFRTCLITGLFYILAALNFVYGQDLNSISGSGFNIVVGTGAINTPEQNTVTLGIQSEFDANYRCL